MKEGIPTHREFTSCDEGMKPAWMQPPHTSSQIYKALSGVRRQAANTYAHTVARTNSVIAVSKVGQYAT